MKAVIIYRMMVTGQSLFFTSLTLCLTLWLGFTGKAVAQTSLPGYTPPAKPKPELSLKEKAQRGTAPLSRLYSQVKLESVRVRRLPALDPRQMRPERNSIRLRIGAVRQPDQPLVAQKDATLFQVAEGNLYVMRVATEGAVMARLHFSQVALPSDARLFVYSLANPDDFHPLHIPGDDGLNVVGQHEFWTPPMTGEEIVIEYLVPGKGSDDPAAAQPFIIDQVSHIFFDPRSTEQNGAAACNLNVPAEWSEAAKSVGLLQFTSPKGEFACSGVLLNDAKNDGTPYFLTAHHCLSEPEDVPALTVDWLYDSGNRPLGTPRSYGAFLLTTSAAGDFSLLQLRSVPEGLRFAGWTTERPATASAITSIHHPQASYKRFSTGHILGNACTEGLVGLCEHFLPVQWDGGITEPGSSGGPLWTGPPSDPRVAGVLTGGLSSCSNRSGTDFYGSFQVAFSAIAPYLTGQGCAFALEPIKQNFGEHNLKSQEIFSPVGGDGSAVLKLMSGKTCAWTATSEAPWITLTSATSGDGESIITYQVAQHTATQPRYGYLLIGGIRLLITQMGVNSCSPTNISIGQVKDASLTRSSCRSTLDPYAYVNRYSFSAQAGQQLNVTMSSTAFDTFLLLIGPDGRVIDYNDDRPYLPNSSNSNLPSITGTGNAIELGDGVYTIEATSYDSDEIGSYRLALNRICPLRFTQAPTLIPAVGGGGVISVATPPACPWSAQSNADWLTLATKSDTGNGTINFTAAANPAVAYDSGTSPREGRISFSTSNGGGDFFTVRQGYNCGYRVETKSLTIKPGDAISDTPVFQELGVSTGTVCPWTGTSNVPWLEFYERGASITETGSQAFRIKATGIKFGDAPRTGTLTLAGQPVSVTIEPLGQLCSISSVAVGQTVSDSLVPNCRSITGQTAYVKQYKFQGRAGQRITILASSLETGMGLLLKRMDGDDGVFAARLTPQYNFYNYDPGTLRMPQTDYITLPADGAYFIEVTSGSYSARSGSFFLSIAEAPAAACDLTLSTNRSNLLAGGGRGSVSIGANTSGGGCAWTATASASWIRLMAASGNSSGKLEYSVDPNTGAFRQSAITVAGQHLLVTQQAANAPISIVSAADYSPNLTIGAIHAMFGNGLAAQTIAATTQPLPTTLGGTQIVVTDDLGGSYDAQFFFVSSGQLNFRVQRDAKPGLVNVTVKRDGQAVASTQVALGYLAPALFTADGSGRGVPAAYVLRVRSDGSRVEEPIYDHDISGRITPRAIRLPDNEDAYLILYGTGFYTPYGSAAEIEVTFSSGFIQKGVAAATTEFAGLDQVNLLLPRSLRGQGDVTLTIKRGGAATNPVTIRIAAQ